MKTHILRHSLAKTHGVGPLLLLRVQVPLTAGSVPPHDPQPRRVSSIWPPLTAPKQRVVLDWTDQAGLTWCFWNRLSCRDGVASAGICKTRETSVLTAGEQQSPVFTENDILSKFEINLAVMEDVSNPEDWIHHRLQPVLMEYGSTRIPQASLSWPRRAPASHHHHQREVHPRWESGSKALAGKDTETTCSGKLITTDSSTSKPPHAATPEHDKAALLSTTPHSNKCERDT